MNPLSNRPPGRDEGPSTRSLLEAYLAGERGLDGELFERHRPQLLKHAQEHSLMRGLKRHTSPEEVVSEAFLRALTSNILRNFEDRGPGSLRNMLMRIVDRVMVDMKRRFEAQKRGGGDSILSVDATREGTPPIHDRLMSPDTTPTQAAVGADMLRACRERLQGREREAWELTVERGLTAREAGEELGVSEATVRSLMYRARERLKDHLGPEAG